MTPDQLYKPGSISFIYSRTGHLWAAPYDDAHYLQYAVGILADKADEGATHAMMLMDPPVAQDVLGYPLDPEMLDGSPFHTQDFWNLRNEVEETSIIGRIDAHGRNISIWNKDQDSAHQAIIDELLEPCLRELLQVGYIQPDAQIYIPSNDSAWTAAEQVSEILDLAVQPRLSPEEEYERWWQKGQEEQEWQDWQDQPDAPDQIALAKRMHLARGAEKQAIMKQLGVGGGGGEHPWARGLKQAGLLRPGQKWHAPHSESVDHLVENWLERFGAASDLEDLDADPAENAAESKDEEDVFGDVEFAPTDAEPDDETARAREIWMERHVPNYSTIRAHNWAEELPQFLVTADYLVDSGRRIWSYSTFSRRDTGQLFVDPIPNRYHGEFSEYCEEQGWPVGYYYRRDEADPYDTDMKGRFGMINSPIQRSPQEAQAIVVSFYNAETLPEVMTALQQLYPMVGSEALYSDVRRKVLFKVGDMIKSVHSRQHPMDTALRKHGLAGPGQHWWAPHSESRLFETRLNVILEQVATHSYGCLMLEVDPALSARIAKWSKKFLPDDWIYEAPDDKYGREEHYHITVVYGFEETTAEEIAEFLQAETPVKIALGYIDKFESADYDVIKINVHSAALQALHRRMVRAFHPVITYPTYKPHITIAYVRPGVADKLLYGDGGLEPFLGLKLVAGEFVFSDAEGNEENINVD